MELPNPWLRLYAIMLALNAMIIAANVLIDCGVHMPFELADQQLDLGNEGNLAVWFSSMQFLAVAISAGMVAFLVRPVRKPHVHRLAWTAVALALVSLSADEVAQIHEWAGWQYESHAGPESSIAQMLHLRGVYLWLVVLSPVLAIGAVGFTYISMKLLGANRLCMILGLLGVLCWIIVIIEEYIEGRIQLAYPTLDRGIKSTIEEGSELLGAMFFLISFLEFFRTQQPQSVNARNRT